MCIGLVKFSQILTLHKMFNKTRCSIILLFFCCDFEMSPIHPTFYVCSYILVVAVTAVKNALTCVPSNMRHSHWLLFRWPHLWVRVLYKEKQTSIDKAITICVLFIPRGFVKFKNQMRPKLLCSFIEELNFTIMLYLYTVMSGCKIYWNWDI